jgi:hypothetical protein
MAEDRTPTHGGRALSMSKSSVNTASILLFFARRAVRFSLFRAVELRCYFGQPFSVKRLK